jgi:hypothetical protein
MTRKMNPLYQAPRFQSVEGFADTHPRRIDLFSDMIMICESGLIGVGILSVRNKAVPALQHVLIADILFLFSEL